MGRADQAFSDQHRVCLEDARIDAALLNEGVQRQALADRRHAPPGPGRAGRQIGRIHPADDTVAPVAPQQTSALLVQHVERLAVQELIHSGRGRIRIAADIRDGRPSMHGSRSPVRIGAYKAFQRLFGQIRPGEVRWWNEVQVGQERQLSAK